MKNEGNCKADCFAWMEEGGHEIAKKKFLGERGQSTGIASAFQKCNWEKGDGGLSISIHAEMRLGETWGSAKNGGRPAGTPCRQSE